jgi:3-mercaptopyruvate sulfurtransferase SseA
MKSSILALLFALLILGLSCAKAPTVTEVKKYEKDADVPRISVADAKKEVDAGTAFIVDSRGAEAYALEHIAGSLNIPFGSNNDSFAKLPPDKKIIVYCS